MFAVVDFDNGSEVVSPLFATEEEAEAYAAEEFGEFWWSNETPWTVAKVE